jgi:hypothetical protein
MNTSWVALGAAALCALAPLQRAAAASAQTEQAMTMIRAACGLANTTLDIQPTPEGRLELRVALANGQRRVMTLQNRDLDAFTDSATLAITWAPIQLASCMDPYIQDITAALAQLPERPAPAPAPPPPAFVPPTLAPAAAPPAPPRPALPPTGDMPVGAVLGTAPAPAVMAAQAGGRLAVSISGCRAVQGPHVQCDLRVTNRTGKDAKLVVQGQNSRVLGEEGSQVQLSAVKMGEHMHYTTSGDHQATMDLIADASPPVQFHFWHVPAALLAIKRMELSLGARIGTDVEVQTFTFSNLPIQGR